MATHEPPPALLRAQIDSIRSQTHRDWVCVISDDASSDAALAEIERAIAGDARFSVESHEERVGFYRNFERALRAVPPEASYVALCDQDDRWHPDKLAALLSALGPDDVLVHSDARVVDSDGRVVSETFWPRGAPRDDRLGDLLFANAVSGASALFRQRRAALHPAAPGSGRPGLPRPLDRVGQPRPGRHRPRRAPAVRLRPAPGRRARPRARDRAVRRPRGHVARASRGSPPPRLPPRLAGGARRLPRALRLGGDGRCACASPTGSAPPTGGACGSSRRSPTPPPPRRGWRRGGSPAHLAAGLASRERSSGGSCGGGWFPRGTRWRGAARRDRARTAALRAARRDGPTAGPGTGSR